MSETKDNKNKEANKEVNRDGLKRRRTASGQIEVVRKPRKMNLVKPKRVQNTTADFSNSSLLVFPSDRMGLTSGVKSEMIKLASKIGKDEKQFKLLQETLDILMKHVEARMNANQELPALKSRTEAMAEREAAKKKPAKKKPAKAENKGNKAKKTKGAQ